jgi:hypothetical protein
MNRYWVSWVQVTEDYRPMNFPPHDRVLGWWKSGECEEGANLCAVVEGESELDACESIKQEWPECEDGGDWRFFQEVDNDFHPSDRFVLSDWMVPRFA